MFRFSNKKALSNKLKCKVKLLTPEDEIELDYSNDTLGQEIFDEVAKEMCLLDKDYYGLKIPHLSHWLDLTKPISKQVKGVYEVTLELRFKYYPAAPALLSNELTRYFLYLQLRIDLIEGRLVSNSQDTIAYLIACVLQSELGDHKLDAENEHENYVAEFKFVPNQTEDLEWAAIVYHRNEDFQGLAPADSELNFLKKASSLDTYGIDPYPVKEGSSKNHFLIGVNYKGISTFQGSEKVNQFTWAEIERISLDNKVVLIYCSRLDKKNSKSKTLFGFRCPSPAYAQNFWRIATEHKFFFTLETKPETPIVSNTGGIFKKSHKLKYAGRVEKDLLREPLDDNHTNRVKRSHSLITKSIDGPRWQGFQQSEDLQNTSNNMYTSSALNKTMPSNLRCFREEQEEDGDEEEEEEEEEEEVEDCSSMPHSTQQRPSISVYSESRKRTSIASSMREDPNNFIRRPILTTKSDCNENKAIYLDAHERTKNFLKTTCFLILTIFTFLLVTLLINDSTTPSSMTLFVKKMKLEPISEMLQQNYYLPLKASIRSSIDHLLAMTEKSDLIKKYSPEL